MDIPEVAMLLALPYELGAVDLGECGKETGESGAVNGACGAEKLVCCDCLLLFPSCGVSNLEIRSFSIRSLKELGGDSGDCSVC